MLNIKTTDFQKDKVWLSVRVDGGTLLATRDDPTRVALAGSLAVGGLQAHSFDDLRTIFAGKTVNPSFGTGVDAFGGSALTSSQDFRFQADLMAAYLPHPGYRADGLALIRDRMSVVLGKRVLVRVDLVGSRIIKKQTT